MAACLLFASGPVFSQDGTSPTANSDLALHSEPFAGPDAVQNQLSDDAERKSNLLDLDVLRQWEDWKQSIAAGTGFDFGLDYTALGFAASESPGADTSAGGAIRFYGSWDLIGRGADATGSIVFKVEHRHGYTDVPPIGFGFEIGYAGLLHPLLSDQGTRVTHLFWRQRFFDGRAVAYLGFLDISDYTDAYALASPWTAFSNLVFSTGSGTIAGLPDGALGIMVGGLLTDHIYADIGIVDANGDPTDLPGGVETFFEQFETFKSFEIGWTTGKDELFLNNIHLSLWQIDERTAAGSPDAWGANISASGVVDGSWLPFLRAGWAQGGGSLYELSVSTGVGFQPEGSSNLAGAAINWARPNPDSFGTTLGDEITTELFYRLQLSENIQITPSIQVIIGPALDPQEDVIIVGGMRARVAF